MLENIQVKNIQIDNALATLFSRKSCDILSTMTDTVCFLFLYTYYILNWKIIDKYKFLIKGIKCYFQVENGHIKIHSFLSDHIDKFVKLLKYHVVTYDLSRDWLEEEELRKYCNDIKDAEGVVVTLSEKNIKVSGLKKQAKSVRIELLTRAKF
jgi:hypothetical protein